MGVFAILVLASALRVDSLGLSPAGLFFDEASTGYDARLIAHTGHDQHGAWMPRFARSLEDYNEAQYRYWAIPFVLLPIDPTTAVRIPAALAGVLAVLFVFLLLRRWYGVGVACLGAAVLAVEPWHVAHSRIAMRAVLFPMYLLAALWLVERCRTRASTLPWLALVAVLGGWTYSSARLLFVPVVGLAVLLRLHGTGSWPLRGSTWAVRRQWLLALLIAAVGYGLLASFWLSEEGMFHARVLMDGVPGSTFGRYLSYFHPDFLFFEGDGGARHSFSHYGELGTVCFAFGWLGVVRLLTQLRWLRRAGGWRRPDLQRGAIALTLLLLGPIPAALTAEGQAMRAIGGLLAWSLMAAHGAAWLASGTRRPALRKAAAVTLALALLVEAVAVRAQLLGPHRGESWWHGEQAESPLVRRMDALDGCLRIHRGPQYVVARMSILYLGRISPDEGRAMWERIDTTGQREPIELGRWRIWPAERILADDPTCPVAALPEHAAIFEEAGYRRFDSVRSPVDGRERWVLLAR